MFGQWSTKLNVLAKQGTDPLTNCTRVDRCFAQVSCFLVESNPEGRLMATLDGAGGGTGSACRRRDDSVHGGDMNGCWSQRSWLPRTTTLSTRCGARTALHGARSQPPGLMESRQVRHPTRKPLFPLEKIIPCTTLKKKPLNVWLVGLVWFGLVWFGLVWFGLVWFGLVWFGLVWFGLVWFGLVWFGLVWFGLVWFGLVGWLVGWLILMRSTPLPWTPLPRAPLLRTIQNFAFCFIFSGFSQDVQTAQMCVVKTFSMMKTLRDNRNSTKDIGNWENKNKKEVGRGTKKARNFAPHLDRSQPPPPGPHPPEPPPPGPLPPGPPPTWTASTRTAPTLDRPTFF